MTRDNNILISARGIKKTYTSEPDPSLPKNAITKIDVLRGLDLDIYIGEAVCIMGSSGAGKSTLLHLLGALDRPSSGTVHFRQRDIFALNDDQLSVFRNKTMGFVFQFHHLLSEFTALENVMMPALIGGISFREARGSAEQLLKELGLQDRLHHRPATMSGGEQQRVAIARALVRQPAVVFADEPTGNLDQKNGQQVQNLLFELQKRRGLTLVTVTHDFEFARKFPKLKTMRDGQWH
ncbi:MAG: ABC transporter ATP-binding protein [Oligoflexia bacterium]|nr:ABC transporter ATP-binding protein [Oligoflexia bacterium]